MLYTLQLSKTFKGLVRVKASIGRSAESVIAIYENEDAFLKLVRHADLDDSTVSTLENMVANAFSSPRRPTCCADIQLTNEQLRVLRLRAILQLTA
jgi:hypothetical protein